MLMSVALLIQLGVRELYSTGSMDPSEYMLVGTAFAAPILSLLALAKRTGWGLLGDFIERLRAEEALRLERARAALKATRGDK